MNASSACCRVDNTMQRANRIRAAERSSERSRDAGGALLFYTLGAALLGLFAFIISYFPKH